MNVTQYVSPMEPTSCNTSLDKGDLSSALVIMSSTGGASLLVCSIAVAMVMMFKLYKLLAYRLALYEVTAAMAYGAVCSMQVIFVNFDKNPPIYSPVCQVVASLSFYLEWVKLLFTTCMTFHLFCFAVFYKNVKKLEIAYIACSGTVPIVLAFIPYITHTYGRAGAWCFIQDWKSDCPSDIFETGNVEMFALWYGPAFLVLLLDSIAMVAMGIALTCRAHRNKAHEYLQSSNMVHRNALRQMLPLLSYPIINFIQLTAIFSYRLYSTQPHPPNYYFLKVSAIMPPSEGVAFGSVLILHVTVAKCMVKRVRIRDKLPQRQNGGKVEITDTAATNQSERTCIRSSTHYIQPNESEVDQSLSINYTRIE